MKCALRELHEFDVQNTFCSTFITVISIPN